MYIFEISSFPVASLLLFSPILKAVFSPSLEFLCCAAKSLQSCLTLCNPIDCSSPGSLVPGILQARVLEWGAIAFSAIVVQKLLVLIRSHLFVFAFISDILGGGS